MKKTYFFLLLLGLIISAGLNAQNVVITEIMYNDPSTGIAGDSLEFIEIYNPGSGNIDLTGYTLSLSAIFTFPAYTMQGNSYVIVARNDTAVMNEYFIGGVLQWTSGSLPNAGGGTIVLKDNLGITVDSVRYNNAAPWPTAASGQGASMMLCDVTSDNNVGSNWGAANPSNANTYNVVNNMYVFAFPYGNCLTVPAYSPSWATLPFTENFDSAWTTASWIRDVPGIYWETTPSSGNASWRRNDDGIAANWTNSANGAYGTAGVFGSIHSARFHSAAAVAGSTGALNLYLDFTAPGNKRLIFWYLNTSGTDSLVVNMSVDSGLTYTFLQKYTTTMNAWTQKYIDLGTSVSPHTIIQFKAYGTAASGTSDIGLDGVIVKIVQGNDAGITAITQPSNILTALTDTVKVNYANFGGDTLTSVQLNWSVNGAVQAPVVITPGLAPGGVASAVLGAFTFPANGFSTIKAWTSLPNNSVDADASNDTTVLAVFYQNYAPIPYFQHFDSAWIDKFSNHDAPDMYWSNLVSTGNSSWRMASDGASAGWNNVANGAYTPAGANNTAESARFHTAGNAAGVQGTFDLHVDLSLVGTKELRFSHINLNGTDSLAVWISMDGGASFNYLTKFIAATTWTPRVVLIGANTANQVIIRFRATANNNGNTDIGIDEVSVNLVQPDAGILAVVSPQSNCDLTTNEPVSILVKNFGNLAVSSVPVAFYADLGAANYGLITTPLQPGDTVLYTFPQTADLSLPGRHVLSFVAALSNDVNILNDSVVRNVFNKPNVSTFPYFQDYESTTYTGWDPEFIAGMNEWELGTPVKTNLNSAYSGLNAWVTGLTANFHNSTNSFVSSPCFDLSTLDHPVISVWMQIETNSNSDAMVLEASVNDSAWAKVGDSLFYNNYSNNQPVAPPKWAGTNGGWTQYQYVDYALAHKAKVAFRFRFQSNATNNNEGIAFDDFMITDSLTVGTPEIAKDVDFMVFPNPARDIVSVRMSTSMANAEIRLVNALGQVVQQKKLNGNKQESFDISGLPSGLYGIVLTSNGKTTLKKLIIE